MAAYFTPDFLQFFRELASNNHKEWFDDNRSRYEKSVKEPFKELVADLLDGFKVSEPSFLQNISKSIFRINRDVRFSKNKELYKLNVAAAFGPHGRKDWDNPGYYIHFGPGEIFLGGGMYKPSKEMLFKVRKLIYNQPNRLNEIIEEPKFKKLYGKIKGDKNKILPKEFKDKAEVQPLLFNKGFYYMAEHSDEFVLKDNLLETIQEEFKIAKPLNSYLSKANYHEV